jgi:hypothetical protein
MVSKKGGKTNLLYLFWLPFQRGRQKLDASTLHIVVCVNITEQMKGKKKKSMLFAVSMVQCEPNRHLEDSYFCLMKVSGFSMSSINKMEYPNIFRAIKPIPHKYQQLT